MPFSSNALATWCSGPAGRWTCEDGAPRGRGDSKTQAPSREEDDKDAGGRDEQPASPERVPGAEGQASPRGELRCVILTRTLTPRTVTISFFFLFS